MDLAEFCKKYEMLKDDFNNQIYDERVRLSSFMRYEAVRELIRSKKLLYEAIEKINTRIKEIAPELDEYVKRKL